MVDILGSRLDYRRVYSEDRQHWFELRLDHRPFKLLEGDTLDETYSLYDEFGKWFSKECKGTWAYPRPGVLLFSDEEDKVKVILKYL